MEGPPKLHPDVALIEDRARQATHQELSPRTRRQWRQRMIHTAARGMSTAPAKIAAGRAIKGVEGADASIAPATNAKHGESVVIRWARASATSACPSAEKWIPSGCRRS